MILSALTDYNLGYTLEETAARLKKKTHRRVSPSTITSWLDEYKQHCSYRRLRAEGLRRFPAKQTIRSIKLYHRQVYGYAYHRPKLDFVRAGTLDDKRSGDTALRCARRFLGEHPDDLPARSLPPRRRSESACIAGDTNLGGRIAHHRQLASSNAATEAAALIIPAVGNNKLRHETLQRFMLCNDSVTVAIEIPIWLDETDIAALEHEHGIELAPRGRQCGRASSPATSTFCRCRNGAVHVLDYKPDAPTNKPIAQLAIYALALTRRVPGLKLFDIKCAWFNEHEYCEFFPRTLFTQG